MKRVSAASSRPLRCPTRCGQQIGPGDTVCSNCGMPVGEYLRLRGRPDALFNGGLQAARRGDYVLACELLSAVVHWCPSDLEARVALGFAYYHSSNAAAARRHFEAVIDRAPGNEAAGRGLGLLRKGGAQSVPSRRRRRRKKKR